MTLRFTAALLAMITLAMPALAQEPWQYHTTAGEYAFARGDVERAEHEFRSALEVAQRFPPNDPRLEASLGNLGLLYEHQMRLDEAQPLYQLQLAAREERLGEEHPALLDILVAVARTGLATGDSPVAQNSLERYAAIAAASGAADPAQHWRTLAMLARVHTLGERPEEALAVQRQVVAVLATDDSATELERAAELESLAQMELLHGTAGAAEPLVAEAAGLRAVEDPMAAVESYASAASTAFGAAEPELAERFAGQARAALPEGATEPLAVSTVLADVSWLKIRRGSAGLEDLLSAGAGGAEVKAARDSLEALLERQRSELPASDPAIAETLSRLAQAAAIAGDAESAARWQRQLIEALGGAAEPAARSDLVAMLAAAGRDAEAITENEALIRELEAAHGADSSRLVPALERQLELLTEAGRKKEAKAVKKRLRKLAR